ncbi:hypothetical protein RCL1_008265 [Eukaryota sp. TZLM3-RCL]
MWKNISPDSHSRSSGDLSLSDLGISLANPFKESRCCPTIAPPGFRRLLMGNQPPNEDAPLIAVPSAWL